MRAEWFSRRDWTMNGRIARKRRRRYGAGAAGAVVAAAALGVSAQAAQFDAPYYTYQERQGENWAAAHD